MIRPFVLPAIALLPFVALPGGHMGIGFSIH
jgi:hypothetical protein